MATVMCNGNSNGNGNRDGEGDRDGDGNCNDNGHSKGNNDKGRVAYSCAGNVQCCGRGNTLPTPPWTQRKVHSPALHHGGDLQRVFAPFKWRGFLTAHHELLLYFFFL
jgi:hypothetical protein